MKRKLAFVVQRYGLEVNGGAELLSRQLVEHLQQQYDIEVLTTKAIEYTTWKNEYTNDVDVINGVTVRRFGVDKPRDLNRFGKFSGKVIGNPEHTMEQEEQWFEMQGPHVPELIDYIKDHADDYEAFIAKNGNVSVHGNYIVYCDTINYSTGDEVILEQLGSQMGKENVKVRETVLKSF